MHTFTILSCPTVHAAFGLRPRGAVRGLFLAAAAAAGLASADTGARPHPPIPVLNWEARSDWKSVKEAGAVGDGVADDTAAIQRVLDSVGEAFTVYAGDRDTVYFPPGTYRITAPLRVGGKVLRTHGTALIGHGRDSRLVWDGADDQPMMIVDSITYARYEGLVFDGRGRAGVGMLHPNRGYTTESRRRHLAFLNLVDAGVLIDRNRAAAESEAMFENCYFERCGRGVAFLRWNDYHYLFDGCEFRNCGIGIDCNNGSFYVRNTHFAGSRIADIKAHPHHSSSLRRVTSLNSQQLLLFSHSAGALTLQDVHVSLDCPYTGGAILASGLAPIIVFDSVVTTPEGGSSPVKILGEERQPVILSNNRVEGSSLSFVERQGGQGVYQVPPGERGGLIRSAGQRFIKETVRIPGKVFDAKRDFGAAGDGRTDDTGAIQATIDAARGHGRNAIAYLPAAAYLIKDTLKVTGGEYTVGGQGYGTILRWGGAENGTALHVHDPRDVTLEFFQVATTPGENNGIDILQTGSGAGSSVVYDGVRVFGCYQRAPFRKGLHLSGLGGKDQVVINMLQGNLQVINCGDATILGNATWEGSVVVEGADSGRNGFLGFQSRLVTQVTHVLYVRDNHSLVASDLYNEQSEGILHLSGRAGQPAGRVVVTGGRSHVNEGLAPASVIENYRGELFIGGKDFSDHRALGAPPQVIRQTGEAPLDVTLFGCFFYGAKLMFEKQDTMRLFMIGSSRLTVPQFIQQDPADAFDDKALAAVSRALDDLRRLGEMDLKLNHPEALVQP